MMELKADKTFVFGEECMAYKKDDVDCYIEELHKCINGERYNVIQLNAIGNKVKDQLRHQKRKRCLAMAAKYLWKRNYWRDSTPCYERQHQWENMAYKHYKRLLELADKFKE